MTERHILNRLEHLERGRLEDLYRTPFSGQQAFHHLQKRYPITSRFLIHEASKLERMSRVFARVYEEEILTEVMLKPKSPPKNLH